MLLRLQTKTGLKRIEIDVDSESCSHLYKVAAAFCDDDEAISLFADRACANFIPCSDQKIKKQFTFVPGDIVYVSYKQIQKNTHKNDNKIDDIDRFLSNLPRQVLRGFDEKMCRHNRNGQCVYCCSVSLFDEQFLGRFDPPLRYLPYHCYLRRLQHENSKSENLIEPVSCKVDMSCSAAGKAPSHKPYPEGSCSKCLPKSMILETQTFRFVDNIEFASFNIVDGFIDYWRKTGHQRVGYMFGYYAPITNGSGVHPLSIRAVVVAIFEPKQKSNYKSVTLLDEDFDRQLDEFAATLNLKRVGWIYTHLKQKSSDKNKFEYSRRGDTYYVSGQECITAAHLQNMYPNYCKYSSNGKFGSKFVSVIITGNSDGAIDFIGYQVSNQAMALEEADVLLPTIDHPGMLYLRENTNNKQVVPDVYYKERANSGLKIARPVMLDFFLVMISAGFPLNGLESEQSVEREGEVRWDLEKNYNIENLKFTTEKIVKTFNRQKSKSKFPVLSRNDGNQGNVAYQMLNKLAESKNMTEIEEGFRRVKDLDFLHYLYFNENESLRGLGEVLTGCLVNNSFDEFVDAVTGSGAKNGAFEEAVNVLSGQETVNESSLNLYDSKIETAAQAGAEFAPWECGMCTYVNIAEVRDEDNNIVCEVCGLPKQ